LRWWASRSTPRFTRRNVRPAQSRMSHGTADVNKVLAAFPGSRWEAQRLNASAGPCKPDCATGLSRRSR
jgi:hypothetical protein